MAVLVLVLCAGQGAQAQTCTELVRAVSAHTFSEPNNQQVGALRPANDEALAESKTFEQLEQLLATRKAAWSKMRTAAETLVRQSETLQQLLQRAQEVCQASGETGTALTVKRRLQQLGPHLKRSRQLLERARCAEASEAVEHISFFVFPLPEFPPVPEQLELSRRYGLHEPRAVEAALRASCAGSPDLDDVLERVREIGKQYFPAPAPSPQLAPREAVLGRVPEGTHPAAGCRVEVSAKDGLDFRLSVTEGEETLGLTYDHAYHRVEKLASEGDRLELVVVQMASYRYHEPKRYSLLVDAGKVTFGVESGSRGGWVSKQEVDCDLRPAAPAK